MRKVIYICFARLTDKMARDWYIDCLIERGVTVEYWDVVSLLREEYSEHGERNPEYLRVFSSFNELDGMLRRPENRDAIYVMLISYVARFARIFRLLSKYDCRMLTFAWGALPHDPVYKWGKLSAWLSQPHLCAKEILGRSKTRTLRKLGLVKPFDVAFVAGKALMTGYSHASKVVPINYFDYDHYVEARAGREHRLITGPYAVFLDINLPYHSDLAFCGYGAIDPIAYYESINRFFGLLERKYAIEVVIAAHPRADYNGAIFEGRQIFRLSTAELVRDAEFVLTHTSTSMGYAVLNSKPLVFIYTAAMERAYRRKLSREIRTYSDYLDAPVYNIDKIKHAREVTVGRVNLKCYERYKYDFLTSRQSEGSSTEQIFLRELEAI